MYIPRWSMYGIFTYISPINDPNVGKYTIHGSSGIYFWSRRHVTSSRNKSCCWTLGRSLRRGCEQKQKQWEIRFMLRMGRHCWTQKWQIDYWWTRNIWIIWSCEKCRVHLCSMGLSWFICLSPMLASNSGTAGARQVISRWENFFSAETMRTNCEGQVASIQNWCQNKTEPAENQQTTSRKTRFSGTLWP